MKTIYLALILLISFDLYAPVYPKQRTEDVLAIIKMMEKYTVTLHKDAVSAEFISKVETISRDLDIKADWLMSLMWQESRLNSKAVNSIGATGLIQFLPITAKQLKTTTSALKNMDPLDQLDYVHKYYKRGKGKFDDLYDLYLYTFFPAAITGDWHENSVLKTKNLSAETIASHNCLLDLNKDCKITIKEYKTAVKKIINERYETDIIST